MRETENNMIEGKLFNPYLKMLQDDIEYLHARQADLKEEYDKKIAAVNKRIDIKTKKLNLYLETHPEQ